MVFGVRGRSRLCRTGETSPETTLHTAPGNDFDRAVPALHDQAVPIPPQDGPRRSPMSLLNRQKLRRGDLEHFAVDVALGPVRAIAQDAPTADLVVDVPRRSGPIDRAPLVLEQTGVAGLGLVLRLTLFPERDPLEGLLEESQREGAELGHERIAA